MTHIKHILRRNQTYAPHERWGVFAGLLLLTLAVTAGGGWLLTGKAVLSASSLMVTNVVLSDTALPINQPAAGQATIIIADKETQQPREGIWVGLRVDESRLQTPELTYFGWYSPTPERAFYQTDSQGQVELPLASAIPGMIEYEIYAANPELANDAKYQSLHNSFTIEYQADDQPEKA